MENHLSIIRGIINDLLSSLSAALVHVNDLIIKIERNSDVFPDAILTNEQLSRSIELFLDIRSECTYFLDQLFVKDNNSLDGSPKLSLNQFKHDINEALNIVWGSCDLMLKDGNKKKITDKINLIHKTLCISG